MTGRALIINGVASIVPAVASNESALGAKLKRAQGRYQCDDDSRKKRDRAAVWAVFVQMLEQQLGAMNGKWRKRRSDLSRDGVLVPVVNAAGETMVSISPVTRRKQVLWCIRARVETIVNKQPPTNQQLPC